MLAARRVTVLYGLRQTVAGDPARSRRRRPPSTAGSPPGRTSPTSWFPGQSV